MSITLASLATTLRGLLDRLAAIDANIRQRAELGRLDARTLRDIGLSRAEIDAEIRRLTRRGHRGAFGPREERDDGRRDVSR
jgi:uncharacterized protein YjiS (DUF1127 family)